VDLEYVRERREKAGQVSYLPAGQGAAAKSAEGLVSPEELRKLLGG
jgi:hypothetical protein